MLIAPPPMIDELKRKNFIAIAGITFELVLEEDFTDIVMGCFELGTPYVKELCRSVRIPF